MDNILSKDSSLSGNKSHSGVSILYGHSSHYWKSSQTRKRILVFGTMGEIGPIVRDDLTRLGHYVQLVDFPQNTFRDEPGYRRTLLKAVEDFGPDIILPVGHQLAMARIKEARDKEARIARVEEARIKETGIQGTATASGEGISPLLAGCWIPVPSSEHILLLDSKLQASRIAAELGIHQPEILFINDPSAQTCGNELSLPDFEHGEYIFKRDKSFGGTGVLRPKNREGLLKLIENERTRSFLVQKFIEGTDLSVDCVRFSFPTANGHSCPCEAANEHSCPCESTNEHNNSCEAANGHGNSCGTETFFRAECYVTVERKNGQGPARERKRAECPIAVEYARSILEHIDYQGVCGMDFRIPDGATDNSGPAAGTGVSPLFLECNPRFTGGIGLQIAEGFDIPQILILQH